MEDLENQLQVYKKESKDMVEKKRTMERQNADNKEKIKNNKAIYEQEES